MLIGMTKVSKSVTKAVIPAAGLGTRFLPATKATPKEMLPVVDRPAIQYVVEEAIRAGLNDVLMITGRNKRALEDHFDRVPVLESQLAEQGKDALLKAVEATNELGELHYVRQGDPKGLGHAVLRGKVHVGDEPFAVLLGDDLIDEKEDLLSQMVEVQQATGGSVIALMEVPRESISAYGAAAIEAVEGQDGYVKVTGLVEKPAPRGSTLELCGDWSLRAQLESIRGAGKHGSRSRQRNSADRCTADFGSRHRRR